MKTRLLLLFLCLCLPAAPLAAQSGAVLDKILAVVGNEIITKSDLDLQMLRLTVRNTRLDVNDPAMRQKVLDEMLNRKLVLAQALLDSVDVPEEQVTQQVEEQIRMLEQQYGSTQKLEQAAGLTVSQMKREFREDIKKNLLIEVIQRDKFGAVTITSREVEEFYRAFKDSLPQIPEQVELRQITQFPRVTADFKAAAKRTAEEMLDSLKAGADFIQLAMRHSDDIGTAKNGGDLGMARRGVFVKAFEEAAFGLQPGQLSPVVETEFGFHIIQLVERKGEAVHARHILIRIKKTGGSDSLTIGQLEELRRRILAGEDFAALAREHSEDAASKNYGGELGLSEVSQLSPDLQLIQQNLKVGEISAPSKITLERDYAFAIIQLVRRVAPHYPNLQDDYQRISSYARVFKQNKQYSDWIQSIRESVYWKVYL